MMAEKGKGLRGAFWMDKPEKSVGGFATSIDYGLAAEPSAEKGNPVEVIRDRLSNSIGMVSSVQHASYAEALEALAQLEATLERVSGLESAVSYMEQTGMLRMLDAKLPHDDESGRCPVCTLRSALSQPKPQGVLMAENGNPVERNVDVSYAIGYLGVIIDRAQDSGHSNAQASFRALVEAALSQPNPKETP